MKNAIKLAAVATAGALALTGCSGGGDEETVHVVGFSILKEVNDRRHRGVPEDR